MIKSTDKKNTDYSLLEKLKTSDREGLANLCHEQWSGWMKYLFSKCKECSNGTGNWVMPKELVSRWQRQMNTPYPELSALEQDSDRKEADKFIKLIKGD